MDYLTLTKFAIKTKFHSCIDIGDTYTINISVSDNEFCAKNSFGKLV